MDLGHCYTVVTVPSASLTETGPLPELSRSASVNLSLFLATDWRRTKFVDAPESINTRKGLSYPRTLACTTSSPPLLFLDSRAPRLSGAKSPWCAPPAHPSWGLSVSPVGRPAPTGFLHSPGPGDAASASVPLDWSLGEATCCVVLPSGTRVACAPAFHRQSSAPRAAARPD